jgi:hypothetical protein
MKCCRRHSFYQSSASFLLNNPKPANQILPRRIATGQDKLAIQQN